MMSDWDEDDRECPECGHSVDSHNDAGAYSFGRLINVGFHMCYDTKTLLNGQPGPQFKGGAVQNWCGCQWRPQ